MAVKYVPFDGEQVSVEWSVVLHDMRGDGVAFRVNEGHRTWARQTYFRWLYDHVPGSALAAKPSANAPHIRTGRIDHAIDFNNAAAVILWLRGNGIRCSLPVVGESWHIEVDVQDLVAYAKVHGNSDPVIRPFYMRPFRPNNKDAVTSLQKMLRGLHMTKVVNGKYGVWTRKALRRFQHKHGLKVDGVVGPGTWKALRKAAGGR